MKECIGAFLLLLLASITIFISSILTSGWYATIEYFKKELFKHITIVKNKNPKKPKTKNRK